MGGQVVSVIPEAFVKIYFSSGLVRREIEIPGMNKVMSSENSLAISFERFLFHIVFSPLGKIKTQYLHLTLLVLQSQIFTILRIPYVPHSIQQIFIICLVLC